jgi:hypothetical protein
MGDTEVGGWAAGCFRTHRGRGIRRGGYTAEGCRGVWNGVHGAGHLVQVV